MNRVCILGGLLLGLAILAAPALAQSGFVQGRVVDEEGNLWFDDVEEGVRILRERNAGALQKAYFAALKLNGLAEEDLEEARRNFDETPSDELGSS